MDKYTWVDIGSSFLPSEIVAAFLYAQLEEADTITRKRQEIFRYYAEQLEPLARRGFIRMPAAPDGCRHNAHLFYLIVETEREDRGRLIAHLKKKGIGAVFHYVPLHTSPMGRKMGCSERDLPVTEEMSERLIRLPCYYELTREDQDRVIDAILEFFGDV